MKTVYLQHATGSLADYARQAGKGTLIVTNHGKPVAALVEIGDADWETLKLSASPRFMEIIEESRSRQKKEGGLSSEEVRKKFKVGSVTTKKALKI
jgi:formylmethanofuran dehydrogenase subunit E